MSARFQAVAVAAVQIVGSALIIWGRAAWLGAGMLGIFTALTIPIAHAWTAIDDDFVTNADSHLDGNNYFDANHHVDTKRNAGSGNRQHSDSRFKCDTVG